MIDAFSGGAFSQASILALGIMPYISASIFMQLMSILVPQMQKVQKDGESGRKKINQWTRYLTVVVTFAQAYAYVGYLKTMGRDAIIDSFSAYFWLTTPILLTAGTLFVMWIGEKITDKGLGQWYFHHYHDWYPCSFSQMRSTRSSWRNRSWVAGGYSDFRD